MATLLSVIAIMAVLAVLIGLAAPVYFKFRGKRVVTCPETNRPAGVEVDAMRALFAPFGGKPEMRLSQCSRWPERQGCGQECLRQIEAAPMDCLVRNILTRWYADKTCALCHRSLDNIDWLEHKPALLSRDLKSVEWKDVAAENIPDVLATHLPLCWNCHIAETFRQEHPDLVVDRNWK